MKFYSLPTSLILLLTFCLLLACETEQTQPTDSAELAEHALLVFSKTEGFRHDSIEHGIQAVQALGRDNGLLVHATEDASIFTPEQLEQYDAVLFLNTTGTIFNEDQR